MKNDKDKNTVRLKMLLYTIGLLLGSTLFTNCENFVEVGVPDSQLTGEVVFQDKNTAEAALVNIYNRLRDAVLVTGGSNGISTLLGYYADEFTYYGNLGSVGANFYTNGLLSSDLYVAATWNDSYNLVYQANAVLEGVKKSAVIAEEDKKQLEGEALFVRAYIQFHLLNLFGSIPYITTTDYRINTTVGKIEPGSVYPLIIADLEEARSLLSDTYVGADRVRPNRSVATALLARIYLYTNNWTAAETEATSVINNTAVYTWVGNLDNVFLKNSTGTLWQLMPASTGANTKEAQQFIFNSVPPPSIALSNELLAAFEPGDQRKMHWTGSLSNSTGTWYYAYKYKQKNTTASSVEYSILFRLEELYLIRAEARAQNLDIMGAQADLNKIRNRAGLADTPANTKEQLVDAIIKERRVELFSELGHRWFDLKRTGKANTILDVEKPGWDATDILWPLPKQELLLNPKLEPQNPGY